MNRTQNCAECEYMKMFDYGNKIYYCDHEDRSDDMGKLSVGELPEGSPVWCPLKKKQKYGSLFEFLRTGDLIQMDTNTSLTDIDGKPIEIRVPEPEYIDDI